MSDSTASCTLRGRSVLVTGGAGFIGSHLVDRLVNESPRRICVIDNLWLGRPENLSEARRRRPDIELLIVDATRPRAVRDALAKAQADVVFNLATIPLPASHQRPRWSVENILKMTTVLVDLARLGEFGTLVHCSSSEVYGSAVTIPMAEDHPLNPETPYAAAKAGADLIVQSYWETFGIDATIIRPFNTYGPRQNDRDYAGIVPITLRRIQRGEPPVIFGDGEQTRDYIYVSDTVDALVRAYVVPASRRRVINVASGVEVSINALVASLCRLSGALHPPLRLPARVADVRRHHADISAAREILSFHPRVGLEEGLQLTVDWYRASGASER